MINEKRNYFVKSHYIVGFNIEDIDRLWNGKGKVASIIELNPDGSVMFLLEGNKDTSFLSLSCLFGWEYRADTAGVLSNVLRGVTTPCKKCKLITIEEFVKLKLFN